MIRKVNRTFLMIVFLVLCLIGYKEIQGKQHSPKPVIAAAASDQLVTPSPPKQKQEATKQPSPSPASSIQLDSTKESSGEGITAIGDSVLVGVAPILEEQLPGIVINGKVSRQMRQAQAVVDELMSQGKLGDRIIIELGTNGPIKADQLRSLLRSLRDKNKVILVNTRVPREWQDSVNKVIADVAKEFPNTAVVDWHSASKGKDNYFYQDGVHPNKEGARYYASLLLDALKGNTNG